MKDKIISILKNKKNIDGYRLVLTKIRSGEMFLVRDKMDMNRAKNVQLRQCLQLVWPRVGARAGQPFAPAAANAASPGAAEGAPGVAHSCHFWRISSPRIGISVKLFADSSLRYSDVTSYLGLCFFVLSHTINCVSLRLFVFSYEPVYPWAWSSHPFRRVASPPLSR